MTTRNLFHTLGTLFAVLLLFGYNLYGQFEFAPTIGGGVLAGKHIKGVGFSADAGGALRYTFLQDATVSLQLRLDLQYSYLNAPEVQKNLFRHPDLTGADDANFIFAWQDHLVRIPLTIGIRPNAFFNRNVTLRIGAYYGRGFAGKASHKVVPTGFDLYELSTYVPDPVKAPQSPKLTNAGGNMSVVPQNEHRYGLIGAIDFRLGGQLEASLYYTGDLISSWDGSAARDGVPVIPHSLKIGLSYWF